MKKSRFFAQVVSGLLLAVAALSLTACGNIIYREPEFQYAGRAVPPSGLLQRVLVSYTSNGSSGGLEILDGLRDTRSNVQDTIPAFFISGYSAAIPATIINFPEQQTGYVLSQTDGVLSTINYAKEQSSGTAASFGGYTPTAAAAVNGTRFGGVNLANGVVVISDASGTFSLNLPNAYKIVINQGNSVVLVMVRNSNTLYRVIKLPTVTNNSPVYPPGAVDCEPLQTPRYCVVPVGSAAQTAGAFDHPYDAYFSLDGNTVYVLNCGPECGGTQASVEVLNQGPLQVDNLCIPGFPNTTAQPLCTTYTTSSSIPSPITTLPVPNPIPVPGGVTVALSSGTNLYLAGQSLQTVTPTGSSTPVQLFGGNLSVINLATYTLTSTTPISDGTHTRLLFADDNTLWAGSSQCANGVRQATGANYNCLTRLVLSSSGAVTKASLVPNVTPGGTATVAYPNTNLDPYYYGNLTGICWVQGYHKVYTAYGGQIHAFNTSENTSGFVDEINNQYITVQGTVLDVAYMDAISNSSN